jgi:hypothetical protein
MTWRVRSLILLIAVMFGCPSSKPVKPGNVGPRCLAEHHVKSVVVEPGSLTLAGATFAFCLSARTGDRYCFTANIEASTIALTRPPTAAVESHDHSIHESNSNRIEPSAKGKGLTVCTADKATCHQLPIAAANIGSKPMAVSEDATLVAIDTRNYRKNETAMTPGRLETWDAVTGKKLASLKLRYGRDHSGQNVVSPRALGFLGHTVLAFTTPECALPCSVATLYSVRGKYLGELAADPTIASAHHFHDDLYVLHGPIGEFIVQDLATGKVVRADTDDTDTTWDAIVTADQIVRVVVPDQSIEHAPRTPRVDVFGADLKPVTEIAVPTCAVAPAR